MPKPTKPEIELAVAGQKAKASTYNDNMQSMLDYVDECMDYAVTADLSNLDATGEAHFDSKFAFKEGFNSLTSSGTILLTNNTFNVIQPSGAVTFSLPTVSSSVQTISQILVQVKLSTVYSINVGTTYYFNKKAPNMSTTGWYNLVYEYDKQNGVWVCGCMKKGTV